MFKPMLANKYSPQKAVWPGYIQPKLDGVRCLCSNKETWTRNLKPHKDHIMDILKPDLDLPEGFTLDGELILPNNFSFQDTVSVIKKENPNLEYLFYFVYDIITPLNMPFRERQGLIKLFTTDSERMYETPTYMCNCAEAFENMAQHFIQQGYEGAIYRNPEALYHHGRSGRDLLKYKLTMDAEYLITGYEEGSGKNEGTPVFICQITEDDYFKCVPKGSYDYKKKLWEIRDKLVGKLLTVQYQELTDGGIPRFPIGISIRDFE